MKIAQLLPRLIAGCFLFTGASAFADGGSGVLFDVNLFYNSSKTETTNAGSSTATVNSDSTGAVYDVKLGYLTSGGFYFGGIYTSRSESLSQVSTTGSATGASFGYMGRAGIFLQGHYLTSATFGTYSEGSGMQADLGYKAGIGSGLLLGAQLSYRSINYKKDSANANLTKFTSTEVLPMLSIGYMF